MNIKRKIMKIINKDDTITIGKATNEILGLKHDIYAMPILDKEEKFCSMIDKLFEETKEVVGAYLEYARDDNEKEYKTQNTNKIINEIINETLDVIQVCIGILYKASKIKGINIKDNFKSHMDKLIYRGWKIKGIVNISKSKL